MRLHVDLIEGGGALVGAGPGGSKSSDASSRSRNSCVLAPAKSHCCNYLPEYRNLPSMLYYAT